MQIVELLKLTQDQIALVFRVPFQVLGRGRASFSAEAMLSFWLASGLGFAVNHVEQAFDKLFGLAGEPIEFCKLSTDALLRTDRKDRVESLARAVQSGIMSPNEARSQEGLDAVEFRDEPRMQQQ